MANIYRVLEITRDGRPTGKYRMTCKSDELSSSPIFGICDHEHDTREQARDCPVVVAKMAKIFPPEMQAYALVARVAELEKEVSRLQQYKEEFDDICEEDRRIMEDPDQCGFPDEKHCTCVPRLKRVAKKLKEERDKALAELAQLKASRLCDCGKPLTDGVCSGHCDNDE